MMLIVSHLKGKHFHFHHFVLTIFISVRDLDEHHDSKLYSRYCDITLISKIYSHCKHMNTLYGLETQ